MPISLSSTSRCCSKNDRSPSCWAVVEEEAGGRVVVEDIFEVRDVFLVGLFSTEKSALKGLAHLSRQRSAWLELKLLPQHIQRFFSLSPM
jgi:hypothetical protein